MSLVPGSFEPNQRNHNKIVANLLKRTREISPETMRSGSSWYPSGQQDAQFIGEQSGQGRLAGAAILGRLSPTTDWDLNRLMAIQTLHVPDRGVAAIREAVEMPKEKDDRLKELAKSKKNKLRETAGLPGTPLGNQTLSNVNTSLKVRNGEISPLEAFNIHPNRSRKVSDFALTLESGGEHPHAVIDTHAYDAAMDSVHVPYNTGNTHMKKAGIYNFIQTAYADAHQQAIKQNLIPPTMTMGDFQAAHWIHQQNKKKEVSARSSGSRRGTGSFVQRMIAENPHLDPAKHGLAPIITRTDGFSTGITEGR